MAAKRKKITLIETDKKPAQIRKLYADRSLQPVEIWIQRPDKARAEKVKPSARLCSCRRVCLAFVEP